MHCVFDAANIEFKKKTASNLKNCTENVDIARQKLKRKKKIKAIQGKYNSGWNKSKLVKCYIKSQKYYLNFDCLNLKRILGKILKYK